MAWKTGTVLPSQTGFAEPPRFENPELLQSLMLEVVKQGGSDTFFQGGTPVLVEIYGKLRQLTGRRLTTEECLQILNWAAGNDGASTSVAQGGEAVASYSAIDPLLKDARGERLRHRFRVNATRIEFRNGLGVQIVMRSIPSDPPHIRDMGLDQALIDACTPRNGIVYITGATGSGKTTTFAALLRYIMEADTPIKGNINTFESPIEFVFDSVESPHSIIAQSEVPRDVKSFADGVRSSMRRHPALIVIGETRDWDTASASIEASNTGHPVFTTVHANEVETIYARLLSRCPVDLRDAALFDLISTGRVLVNQTLARTVDGKRTPLREYLIVNDELREEMLAVADPARITAVVRDMVRKHGKSMEQAAIEAYENGLIAEDEMKKYRRRVHG